MRSRICLNEVILIWVEMRMGNDTGCVVTRRCVTREVNGSLCRGEKYLGELVDS